MLSAILIELAILLLLTLVNGAFALAEMALVSARPARLTHRAAQGDRGARQALDLLAAPTRFLSTVQLGITLVGVVAGAFGGATLSTKLAAELRRVPLLTPYSEALGLGLVVLVVTYLTLVVGELAPKRLALAHAERLAVRAARPLWLLSALAAPAVHLLGASTDLVLRILRVRAPAEPAVTEEEVRLLIAEGTAAGVFMAAEQDMVERVFRLADQRVDELMTPRPQIVWLDVEAPPDENWRRMRASHHAQFPVCRGSIDRVLGMVTIKDVWEQTAMEPATVTEGIVDLAAVTRPALLVPESLPALDALAELRDGAAHAALVLDEYGGTEGIITLIDVLEALVGDLPAPGEPLSSAAVRRADGSWLIDGILPVAEVWNLVAAGPLPGEARGAFQTIGGLVMAELGRVPRVGDSFGWQGLRIEVVDMDGRRVDKVLIHRDDSG